METESLKRDDMDLSVVIVSYNSKELLRQCLIALVTKVHGIAYEIYVVDNGSIDGSVEMIQSGFPSVRIIANHSNLGFARANNQAIQASGGKYLLLLNSDAIITSDNLHEMINYMAANPQVGALGCRIINPDGTIQTSNNAFPNIFTEFLHIVQASHIVRHPQLRATLGRYLGRFMGKVVNEYLRVYWDNDRIREVDWATAACLLVRRETITEVGLLDERFFMYYEDADWCLRIHKAGWKIVFHPSFIVLHHVASGRDSRFYSPLQDPRWHKSRFWYYRKHASLVERVCLRCLVLVGALFFMLCNLSSKQARTAWREIMRLCFSCPL